MEFLAPLDVGESIGLILPIRLGIGIKSQVIGMNPSILTIQVTLALKHEFNNSITRKNLESPRLSGDSASAI